MNELQRAAISHPAAEVTQIGREHFRVLRNSPYNASIGLSLNK